MSGWARRTAVTNGSATRSVTLSRIPTVTIPRVPSPLGAKFGLGLLQLGDRPARVADQDLPGIGEHHAAAAPVEKA